MSQYCTTLSPGHLQSLYLKEQGGVLVPGINQNPPSKLALPVFPLSLNFGARHSLPLSRAKSRNKTLTIRTCVIAAYVTVQTFHSCTEIIYNNDLGIHCHKLKNHKWYTMKEKPSFLGFTHLRRLYRDNLCIQKLYLRVPDLWLLSSGSELSDTWIWLLPGPLSPQKLFKWTLALTEVYCAHKSLWDSPILNPYHAK